MAERKLVIYYDDSGVNEDEFLEHVHGFFCKNPTDPTTESCPLYAMFTQSVVEEEG